VESISPLEKQGRARDTKGSFLDLEDSAGSKYQGNHSFHYMVQTQALIATNQLDLLQRHKPCGKGSLLIWVCHLLLLLKILFYTLCLYWVGIGRGPLKMFLFPSGFLVQHPSLHLDHLFPFAPWPLKMFFPPQKM
jgi:hypothetical protein